MSEIAVIKEIKNKDGSITFIVDSDSELFKIFLEKALERKSLNTKELLLQFKDNNTIEDALIGYEMLQAFKRLVRLEEKKNVKAQKDNKSDSGATKSQRKRIDAQSPKKKVKKGAAK